MKASERILSGSGMLPKYTRIMVMISLWCSGSCNIAAQRLHSDILA